jgi:hypothetical protein
MPALTFKQMLMIEAAMPAVADAQAAFIAMVMKDLPTLPSNNDLDTAIKNTLASIAPASTMFGNVGPKNTGENMKRGGSRQRIPLPEEAFHVATADQRR